LSAMISVSWMNFGEFKLARNSNVFLLAKLLDEGPAQLYLESACQSKAFSLCKYRDELHGLTDDDLKWSGESPFQKVGGFDKLEPEAAEIVSGTLRQFPVAVLSRALADAGQQLLKFSVGEGLTPQTIDLVTPAIGAVFGRHVEHVLRHSNQAAGSLPIAQFNRLQMSGLGLSFAFLILVVVCLRAQVTSSMLCLIAFLAASFVWSSLVTGALSGPYDRYLARIIWLAVFAAELVFLHMYRTSEIMKRVAIHARR
jgi:hypothetical protein